MIATNMLTSKRRQLISKIEEWLQLRVPQGQLIVGLSDEADVLADIEIFGVIINERALLISVLILAVKLVPVINTVVEAGQ